MSSSTNIQAHGGLRHGQARRLHRRTHDQGRQSTDNHARRQVADMTTITAQQHGSANALTDQLKLHQHTQHGKIITPHKAQRQYSSYMQTTHRPAKIYTLHGTEIHTTNRRPSEPGKASVDEGVTYTTGNQLQGPQHEVPSKVLLTRHTAHPK